MDFKDQIKQISDRISTLKEQTQTEEATKNAFIMPFIQSLGYDVFNPIEVVPEFTCDIGTKKGEKIDYAILKDKEPIILIECKHWKQNLTLHDNQLLRYFHVSKAKFGVLTNGIIYKFYTDLEIANKMDEKPFLVIDMLDLKENHIEELKKFHKDHFEIDVILSSASELKYTNALKAIISNEFSNPSVDLVKLFAKQVYNSIITPKLLEQFTVLVRKSISSLISDTISERLKTALKTETEESEKANKQEQDIKIENKKENEIITTEEELEGFFIVKSILRQHIASERITYRDSITYFAIFIDNNNRKPVCRLYFNSNTNKQICLFDENKKEIKYKIESLDDIYNHADHLINTAIKYI
jgi:hypothetical protein